MVACASDGAVECHDRGDHAVDLLRGLLLVGFDVAQETTDTPETRDLLFDYFVSKIFVGPASMTIASWFFNGGPDIDFADLAEAKETGEVLNDHQLVTVPLPTS